MLPRSRVVGVIAGHTKDHPDRVPQDDPAAAWAEVLGAQPNQPSRLGLDVIRTHVDVGSYGGCRVIGTEPLEEQLGARARRRIQLAREFVVVAFAPAPAG